ncbi:putative uncharacterized protein DDB_G0286901 [Drosophila mojavensis]|uniref:putative uncharacterized protein DDB_G0286901 n=1 Tax=Drosophila mojavensis TaxID=7230 RepID=UPI0013EE9816|nr:putative uncharacterized protein DDB_G0286901 [Drosophila mojavensis]
MNRNKQQPQQPQQPQQNSSRIRSLGLLDKTLPLTAATPPQLRNRRQFQFNGMSFETNPLSLQKSRGGLDGDAGDGRLSTPEERRDSSSNHSYKASQLPTASRLYRQRSCQSEVSSAGVEPSSPRVAATRVLHQPEQRAVWSADNDSGNQRAGGEDAYSNGYSCNYSNSSAIKSASNNNINKLNHINNNINKNISNNMRNSNSNNNIKNNCNSSGSNTAERFQKVLAKYGKQAASDEYSVNNNFNNNNINNNSNINNSNSNININNNNSNTATNKASYTHSINANSNLSRNYNNRLTGHSYSNNIERKSNIQEEPNSDLGPREPAVYPTRPYSRSLKLSGFRYGQMRAGGGCSSAVANDSKMDYITLAGFLLGYLTSNLLFFLCWYFTWLKGQVVKLRNHFLGQANLWEFFDFEDTTRYSMQTKLLLAPIILGCSILYCVVNVLHLLIKLVRADVPRTVIDLVQRIARNHWP